MIRVGIAGAGFMGEVHGEVYKKLPDTVIYAVAERDSERLEKFAERFSPAKTYSDAFSMVKAPEIDLVDICLPTPLHAPVAIEALRAGKHVLLEKPIALSVEEAEEIAEEAEKAVGKFMVAHVLRFWPEYTVVRKLIQEGRTGRIREIYASRFNELPLWSIGTWIMDERKSGGVIIDLMIHDVDFVLWNMGKPQKIWASGLKNRDGFTVQVMAVLKFEEAVAYLEGGYLNPQGAGLKTEMRVYGEEALVEMDSTSGKFLLTEKGGKASELEPPSIDGYFEEIAYFVDCIKSGKDPEIITPKEALESLRVSQAIRESLLKGKWIELWRT